MTDEDDFVTFWFFPVERFMRHIVFFPSTCKLKVHQSQSYEIQNQRARPYPNFLKRARTLPYPPGRVGSGCSTLRYIIDFLR